MFPPWEDLETILSGPSSDLAPVAAPNDSFPLASSPLGLPVAGPLALPPDTAGWTVPSAPTCV